METPDRPTEHIAEPLPYTASVELRFTMRPTPLQWAMLALILVIAATLRIIFLSSFEPDFDELWHLELSTGRGSMHETIPLGVVVPDVPQLTSLKGAAPWYRIPSTLSSVTHPPLYPVLLRFWRSIFGESINTGRVFSILISVLCVLALFDAARHLHGPVIALWACLILALSSSQIEIAQEVRNYPLLILCCLCAAATVVRIERYGLNKWRINGLALAVLAAVYTHYFAAPGLIAISVYACLRLRGRARGSVLLVIFLAYILFAVTWGPMLARQSQAFLEASNPGAYGDTDPGRLGRLFQYAASTPIRMLYEPRAHSTEVAMFSAALFVLPLLLLRSKPDLLLWWIWLVFVVGFAGALDLSRDTVHLEKLRHTILAGPAVCAMLVVIVSGHRPLLTFGAPAVLALACAAALGVTYSRYNVRFERLGHQVTALERPSDEPVIFYSDKEWLSGWLLLVTSHYSGTFPRPVVRLSGPADAQLIAALHHWRGAWVVWSAPKTEPSDFLPPHLLRGVVNDPILGTVAQLEWSGPLTAPATAATTDRALLESSR